MTVRDLIVALKHEQKRNNHLMALLCQIVIETHGSSLKYRERLEELMKGI